LCEFEMRRYNDVEPVEDVMADPWADEAEEYHEEKNEEQSDVDPTAKKKQTKTLKLSARTITKNGAFSVKPTL
jgi:hypothetical protein